MQQIKVLVLLKTKKNLNFFLKIGFLGTRICKLTDPYPNQIFEKIIGSGTWTEFFEYFGLDTRIFELGIEFLVRVFGFGYFWTPLVKSSLNQLGEVKLTGGFLGISQDKIRT